MGPAPALELRFYHAVPGVHGLYDLTVSNIYTDVPGLPHGQSRRVGHGLNAAFAPSVIVHTVRTHIGHTIAAVLDLHSLGVQPAVPLDEPHAVGGAPVQPVGTDEVGFIPYTLRVLRDLILQQLRRQHLAEGTPHIAPPGVPCVGGIDGQICTVLCGRVCKQRCFQFHRRIAARLIGSVIGTAARAAHDHGIDLHGIGAFLCRDRTAPPHG